MLGTVGSRSRYGWKSTSYYLERTCGNFAREFAGWNSLAAQSRMEL